MSLDAWLNKGANRLTRLLHIDVHFYGRSVSWMALGYITGVVRGVATTFLLARWLPKETLGQFRYVLAFFGLAGMFSLSGLSTSIIRGIAKNDFIVVRLAIKRLLWITPMGTLFLGLAGLERLWHGEPGVALALCLAGIAFPFYSLCGLYGPILTGKGQIPRLVKLAVINNLMFSLAFVVVLLKAKHLLPIILAYLGIDVLIRGIMTWQEIKKLPNTGNGDEHIRLGDHLSAIGVMQALASQLDQILIQRVAGYGTLANYSVAALLPEQIKDFVNGLGGIFLQRLSRRNSSAKDLPATRRHFWTLAAMAGAGIVIYAITCPILIPWLFPQYRQEVLPSILYAIGLLGLASVVGLNFFQATNQVGKLWRFYSLNTLFQIGTNIILIPLFGGMGAVISKTLTRLAGVGLSYPAFSPSDADTRPGFEPPPRTSPDGSGHIPEPPEFAD